MRLWILTLAVVLFKTALLPAQEVKEEEAAATEVVADDTTQADEAAIRQAIASYTESFNKGDAPGLAAHWSELGQFVTPAGQTIKGRKQLEADFAAYFKESANAKLELNNTVVRLLSPSVAIETGQARVIAPDREPNETQYEAIHVRTAEGWKIDSLSEQESASPPPSHYDKLQDLEWMIGRWVDADEDLSIETSCRWTRNQNFIVRSFKVIEADRVDFEGTQIIGWDPNSQAIRSWMFDSDGGFGVGRWSSNGNRWTVNALSVLPDGRRASATTLYDIVDSNTVRFQAIGRQVDGELLPNIGPVEVVRAADE
jgi:uncharacterized protein (TIGR02246 family)